MASKSTSKKFRFRVTGARGAVYETTTYAEAKRLAGKRGVIERIGEKNPHCVSNPGHVNLKWLGRLKQVDLEEMLSLPQPLYFNDQGEENIYFWDAQGGRYFVKPGTSAREKQALCLLEDEIPVEKYEYHIASREDWTTGVPLYQVNGNNNDYVGEWHTDKLDAVKELNSLLDRNRKQSNPRFKRRASNPHLADTYSKVHAILTKEGGAAGLKALKPAFPAGATNIDKALPPHHKVPGVVRHGDGDYLKVKSGYEKDVTRYTNPSLPSGMSRELRSLPVGKTVQLNGKRVRRLDKDHWSVDGLRHKLANATVAVMGE